MAWTYRVMKTDELFGIHEVYEEEGKYTANPVSVVSEDVDGLRWQLEEMLKAIDKGIYSPKE